MSWTSLRLKKGVSIRGIKPEMVLGIQVVVGFFEKNNIKDVWITSCVDGRHGKNSLHYVGYAIDVRIWDIISDRRNWFTSELNKEMGSEFDCVLEKDHIHIEFQPKEKLNG